MELDIKRKLKVFFALTFMVFFVINAFYHHVAFDIIMAPFAVLILMFAFPFTKGSSRYLSIILLILGMLLLVFDGSGLKVWAEALSKNAGITVLLLSLPLLKIVLVYEDFETHISGLTKKYAATGTGFYLMTSVVTVFIGVLINIACVSMVYHLFEKSMKKYPEKLFMEAVTRSFCTNMVWSPNTVSVAVALQSLALPWHAIALPGFLFAVLGNILGVLMVKFSYRNLKPYPDEGPSEEEENLSERGFKDSLGILGLVFLLIFLVVLLTYTTQKSVMVIVPLLSFTFPAVMAVVMKKTGLFKEKLGEYLRVSLPSMNDEMVLFTSIGFFGYALGLSDIIRYIPMAIQKLGLSTPLTFLPFVIFIISSLSLIGLHPLITISAIAAAYASGGMPASPVQMAFALMDGYMLYTLLAPFSGLSLLTASISRQSLLGVSLRLNFMFGLLFTAMLVLILSVF